VVSWWRGGVTAAVAGRGPAKSLRQPRQWQPGARRRQRRAITCSGCVTQQPDTSATTGTLAAGATLQRKGCGDSHSGVSSERVVEHDARREQEERRQQSRRRSTAQRKAVQSQSGPRARADVDHHGTVAGYGSERSVSIPAGCLAWRLRGFAQRLGVTRARGVLAKGTKN